ncbi:F0F1 ATP synthase subunit gamma [Microbulbifer sediminum]|uniref:F0F1 ATP synthase subunit gamma n=1 Tax=Microbulbifer sediminum TaxID=2904250 RepID=UPI001F01E7F9|nr:F0F1 ATP synthase subunit gamma [Microbulbifer sediminum]
MSRQRELQRHQRQLGETREIVSAMKAMAFMEVHRLEKTLLNQRRTVEAMRGAAVDLVTFFPESLPPPPLEFRRVYLLVGSERGFCGNFNENLIAHLEQSLEKGARDEGRASGGIIGLGRRLCSKLEGHPQLLAALDGAGLMDEVEGPLRQLVEKLADLQAETVTTLTVFYHDPEHRTVVERELLPPFESLRNGARGFVHPPYLNIPPAVLMHELEEQYLFEALHEIVYLSLMAENQQRMQHLEGAGRYLSERLDVLRRRTRQLRQEEITEEIEVILLNADSASLPSQPTRSDQVP